MDRLQSSSPLLDHFSALSDPRQGWRVIYPLPEILLLVLCATLSGMDDFVEIRLWGEQRLDFLRRFLPYERGLPAHDTLNDVINALDGELFKTCFMSWVETLRDGEPDVIAIDGKTSRRSHARGQGESLSISSRPGPHGSDWCSARKQPTSNPTRSRPFRCCWSAWNRGV